MTEDVFLAHVRELKSLLDEGNFSEGVDLCQELVSCIETVSLSKNSKEVCRDVARMNAAIVIETGRVDKADRAEALLEKYGDDGYSSFLRARLLWLQEDNFKALTLLEEYYHVDASGDNLLIAPESPLWGMDSNRQQRVLNFLGHAYKFFSLPALAAKCSYAAQNIVADLPTKWQEYSNYLFDLHYLFMPKEDYFYAHVGFNDLFQGLGQFEHDVPKYQRHKKIRVGYISSDFRRHVCLLFIWAMLTQYDKKEFEVYVFSRSCVEDDYSNLIKKSVDGWFNISNVFIPKAARLIHEQEIDILVDLAGHASGNGLPILAYKPAPVQVCGIGYFATTGLKAVDYFLTDRYLINEDTQKYFVEKLLVMPHSHFCYTPLNDMPQASKGAPCRRNGYVTFGSFNNLTKVNDDVLFVWSEVLKRVPQSRLLLKGSMLSNPEGKELMRQKLLSLDLSEDRFELQPFTLPYLEQYYEVDIALDTFPYPGGGTTCDALYMGVPVVTLGDGSHGGNFGISLLKNIGLDECCTYSEREYIERAVLLASDYELLDDLHRVLRNMMDNSPVIDGGSYMEELENGYREIWERFVEGKG